LSAAAPLGETNAIDAKKYH